MHQMILPGRKEVDHRDTNGLNNQRDNLRGCGRNENRYNSRKTTRACTSRFKGVSWNKFDKKWTAMIGFQGKSHYLGQFTDEVEAAKAYNAAAVRMFGEFARPNIV